MSSLSSLSPDLNSARKRLLVVQPLDEAVALIGAARAFIGNDTRLVNIAAACDRLAIGFFAQTELLDYSNIVIPVELPDGRFGEPGSIGRIAVEQAFLVLAATLHRQGTAGAEQPVT